MPGGRTVELGSHSTASRRLNPGRPPADAVARCLVDQALLPGDFRTVVLTDAPAGEGLVQHEQKARCVDAGSLYIPPGCALDPIPAAAAAAA